MAKAPQKRPARVMLQVRPGKSKLHPWWPRHAGHYKWAAIQFSPGDGEIHGWAARQEFEFAFAAKHLAAAKRAWRAENAGRWVFRTIEVAA